MKQLVESVLSKVVEEFEHRIASQLELVCLLWPVIFVGQEIVFTNPIWIGDQLCIFMYSETQHKT